MIIGLWIHVAGVSFSSQVYQKICLNRVFTKAEKKNKMCICSLTWMAVGAISIWPRGLLRRTNGWADGRCATTTENTSPLSLCFSEQTKLHPHVRRWNHEIISKSAHDPVVGCRMASKWHAASNNNLSVDRDPKSRKQRNKAPPALPPEDGVDGKSGWIFIHVKQDAGW